MGNRQKYAKFQENLFSSIWLVDCFGFNSPLRQYFSLYRAVSQREGERGEKERVEESKSVQTTPLPCCTVIQIVGRPGTGSLPSTIAPPDHPIFSSNEIKSIFCPPPFRKRPIPASTSQEISAAPPLKFCVFTLMHTAKQPDLILVNPCCSVVFK